MSEADMTSTEKRALLKSIRQAVAEATHERLFAHKYDDMWVADMWCDGFAGEWKGPEVQQACEQIWREFRKIWTQIPRTLLRDEKSAR